MAISLPSPKELEVLGTLENQELSAPDIVYVAKQKNKKISISEVYTLLARLVKKGCVSRRDVINKSKGLAKGRVLKTRIVCYKKIKESPAP